MIFSWFYLPPEKKKKGVGEAGGSRKRKKFTSKNQAHKKYFPLLFIWVLNTLLEKEL